VWLGGKKIPADYKDFWRRFKLLHPEWECITWRDNDLDWLINRVTYYQSRTFSERSDVARFEILQKYGGIYVDADVEPLMPFDNLRRLGAFAGWEQHGRICGAVMGAEPNHPAVKELVKNLHRWARLNSRRTAEIRTGPVYLTKQWAGRPDVTLLHSDAFYPIHWKDRDKMGGPYPSDSFAVHHWGHSWKEAE